MSGRLGPLATLAGKGPVSQEQDREVGPRRAVRPLDLLWLVLTVGLLVVAILAPVVAPSLAEGTGWFIARWSIELVVVAGLLWFAVGRIPFARVLDVPQRIVLVVLVVGLLAAQFTPTRPDAYPFTHWSMYTNPSETVAYTDYVMLDGDDEVGRLPVSEIVPPAPRGFMSQLDGWVRQAEEGDAEAGQVVSTTIARLLDEHGDPSVDTVEVRWCEVVGSGAQLDTTCEVALAVPR